MPRNKKCRYYLQGPQKQSELQKISAFCYIEKLLIVIAMHPSHNNVLLIFVENIVIILLYCCNLFMMSEGDGRMLRVGQRKPTRNKYLEWFIFTVMMGAAPSIIRLLIFIFFEQQLAFTDFRTELFFLSIVFLVDSLKNNGWKCLAGATSIIILFLCIFVYVVVFIDASQLLSRSPSGPLVERSALVFLIVGFMLDFYSISKK